MLSIVQLGREVCYPGLCDGVAGPLTQTALGLFQSAEAINPSLLCDEETLIRLIQRYAQLSGGVPISADRVLVHAGGASHPPTPFGDGMKTLEPISEEDDLSYARRVEIFLHKEPLQPPTKMCTPSPHKGCIAYKQWCKSVKEVLQARSVQERILITDSLNRPIPNQSVMVFKLVDGKDAELIRTFTTNDLGVLHMNLEIGIYALKTTIDGVEHQAALPLDPDDVAGLRVEFPVPAQVLDTISDF